MSGMHAKRSGVFHGGGDRPDRRFFLEPVPRGVARGTPGGVAPDRLPARGAASPSGAGQLPAPLVAAGGGPDPSTPRSARPGWSRGPLPSSRRGRAPVRRGDRCRPPPSWPSPRRVRESCGRATARAAALVCVSASPGRRAAPADLDPTRPRAVSGGRHDARGSPPRGPTAGHGLAATACGRLPGWDSTRIRPAPSPSWTAPRVGRTHPGHSRWRVPALSLRAVARGRRPFRRRPRSGRRPGAAGARGATPAGGDMCSPPRSARPTAMDRDGRPRAPAVASGAGAAT